MNVRLIPWSLLAIGDGEGVEGGAGVRGGTPREGLSYYLYEVGFLDVETDPGRFVILFPVGERGESVWPHVRTGRRIKLGRRGHRWKFYTGTTTCVIDGGGF